MIESKTAYAKLPMKIENRIELLKSSLR
jgi:hypothetical protein